MRNVLFRLIYRLIRLFRPSTNPPGAAATILVLQYQMPLGCCVHGTPIYAAIRRARPHARLIVATRGLSLAVLRHDPNIDHLIETADPAASGRWAVIRQIRSYLRQHALAPDIVLQDASNRAGSFALLSLLLRLAPTAGFANAPPLYDFHLNYDDSLSLIDNNLRLLQLFGEPTRPIEPAVYFSAEDVAAAKALLQEVNPESRPITAFVMQGSGGQRTGWHDDRFAAVLRFVEQTGHQIIFLGTAADAANINRIAALASSTGRSLAGRTTIPQLAALLCLCDLLVSVDTGTMHIGRAVNLPMVVLGPSWQRPLEWLPLGKDNVRILRGEDRSTVPEDYRLDEIQPRDVELAIADLLGAYPPSEAARNERLLRLNVGIATR
jgi:ADP-heptose:LPS heptosyltransferase